MEEGDTQYAVLTRNRHDRQPPQVLPLDEAHSLAHIRLRRLGTGYAGHGRIHDRGEFGEARIWAGRDCGIRDAVYMESKTDGC